MFARFTVAATLALALAQPASADRFYFDEPADTAAGTPRVVEGVLLAEEDGFYVIRVEGGTIGVDRDLVTRIEETALTVADIEAREDARRDELAQADIRRQELQAAAREAEAERLEAIAAEAAARPPVREREIPFVVQPPYGAYGTVYDPVLHVARPAYEPGVLPAVLPAVPYPQQVRTVAWPPAPPEPVRAIEYRLRDALIRATRGMYNPY